MAINLTGDKSAASIRLSASAQAIEVSLIKAIEEIVELILKRNSRGFERLFVGIVKIEEGETKIVSYSHSNDYTAEGGEKFLLSSAYISDHLSEEVLAEGDLVLLSTIEGDSSNLILLDKIQAMQ